MIEVLTANIIFAEVLLIQTKVKFIPYFSKYIVYTSKYIVHNTISVRSNKNTYIVHFYVNTTIILHNRQNLLDLCRDLKRHKCWKRIHRMDMTLLSTLSKRTLYEYSVMSCWVRTKTRKMDQTIPSFYPMVQPDL